MGLLITTLLASGLGLNEEIEEVLRISQNTQSAEIKELMTQKNPEKSERKCSMTPFFDEQREARSATKTLKIFMSFSVPIATWKEYSTHLQENGGSFILRGLPDNSFKTFSQKVMALREQGILAEISIDPDLFEKHEICAVPAIVLETGRYVDKVLGNISLTSAFRLFAEKGEMRNFALRKLSDD